MVLPTLSQGLHHAHLLGKSDTFSIGLVLLLAHGNQHLPYVLALACLEGFLKPLSLHLIDEPFLRHTLHFNSGVGLSYDIVLSYQLTFTKDGQTHFLDHRLLHFILPIFLHTSWLSLLEEWPNDLSLNFSIHDNEIHDLYHLANFELTVNHEVNVTHRVSIINQHLIPDSVHLMEIGQQLDFSRPTPVLKYREILQPLHMQLHQLLV